MITNLIGRKINQYQGAESTIVAVWVDRGEVKGLAENPDNLLFEFELAGTTLLPEEPCES